jgi:hypothetical protein
MCMHKPFAHQLPLDQVGDTGPLSHKSIQNLVNRVAANLEPIVEVSRYMIIEVFFSLEEAKGLTKQRPKPKQF